MESKVEYDLCILYGSQTGTARFAAEELERELWRFGYDTINQALDDYDFTNLPEESLIVFIVSTTGHGEPPSNMKNFWRFLLRKDLPPNSLENLNYTVFGLGDSSYEKFNSVAKMLHSRLKQLSANLFHPTCLGDDQHDFGYEAEFDPWCAALIEILNQQFFLDKKLKYDKLPLVPKYVVNVEANAAECPFTLRQLGNSAGKTVNIGSVENSTLLTSNDAVKKVLQVHIGSDRRLYYRPGDVIQLYPKNSEESCDSLLHMYGMDRREILTIKKNQLYNRSFTQEFPEQVTCGELIESWLNINGVPSRYFCRVAADFATDELHKEKLLLFASKTTVRSA